MLLSFKSKINLGFLCALSFLLLISFLAYKNTNHLIKSSMAVAHTHEVLENIESIRSLIKDQETGQRGFLLTGKDSYLEIYKSSLLEIGKKFEHLRMLTEDSERQNKNVEDLHGIAQEKATELQQTIEVRKQQGFDAALAIVNTDQGKAIMDRFRSLALRMRAIEEHHLEERKAESQIVAQETLTAASVGSFFAILILILALLVLNKAESERAKNSRLLELNNYVKSGINELYEKIRGEKNVTELAQIIIDFMTSCLEAPIGTIFLTAEKSTDLVFAAGHAYKAHDIVPSVFKSGEGLLGQAGKEQRISCIENIPEEYCLTYSGLGRSKPRMLYLLPLVLEKKTIGVIEIGTLKKLDKAQIEFIEASMAAICFALISAQNRHRAAEFLEEIQAQSEELTSQQEELRLINSQLLKQSEMLKESEEELKTQAEELRQSNEELAEHSTLVVQKNNEINIKNEILEKNKKALEDAVNIALEANKTKSTFLANMSHELRTPLNSILILSEILAQDKERQLNAKSQEYAASIHQSGTDLLELINDILDLSKVEAGKIELQIEDIGVRPLAEAIFHSFEHIAQKKGIKFSLEIADDLPASISGDTQRINQILKNLLANAFKFTSQGTVSLQVGRQNKGSLAFLAFSIVDTGCGIPADKIGHVFQPFQQADSTISRKYGGSGLGLSISRQLAVLLGGNITFSSKEDIGSTFTLLLPETSAKKVAHKPVQISTQVTHLQQNLTVNQTSNNDILIVEDDYTFAQVLADSCENKGFKGVTVFSGRDALAYIKQNKPKAIILDLKLPDMDGLDFLKIINQDTIASRIPVQVISSFDRETEAMHMGAIGFLTKPVNTEKIEQVLQKIERIETNSIKNCLLVQGGSEIAGIVEQLRKCNIDTSIADNQATMLTSLMQEEFDAIIIDNQQYDVSTKDLLGKITSLNLIKPLPTIIYSETNLPASEIEDLKLYAKSVVFGGVKSRERLLDEIQLFLFSLNDLQKRPYNTDYEKKNLESVEGKKVLLVDDDARNIFAMLAILEGEKLNVVIAKNGKESLEQLEQHPDIDLVLMDVMMPVMDGLEAMRRIRKDSRFKSLPIIALTAKAMKDDNRKCMEAGASDYISKPIDMNKFLSAIAIWLGSVSSSKTPQAS